MYNMHSLCGTCWLIAFPSYNDNYSGNNNNHNQDHQDYQDTGNSWNEYILSWWCFPSWMCYGISMSINSIHAVISAPLPHLKVPSMAMVFILTLPLAMKQYTRSSVLTCVKWIVTESWLLIVKFSILVFLFLKELVQLSKFCITPYMRLHDLLALPSKTQSPVKKWQCIMPFTKSNSTSKSVFFVSATWTNIISDSIHLIILKSYQHPLARTVIPFQKN